MQQVKGKNTRPEMIVRSLVHRLGYRFRLHRKDLPGTPDVVFPSRRVALFVHGCFWHGHGCRIGQLPKSRFEYWQPKIAANRDRDARKEAALESVRWRVAVVWQCELADLEGLTARLKDLLDTE
ncbi:MAG: Very-short-patch mismatch repair endonuclease (G-T specific) [uncultured Caballeronia sp.]|nr:MAG: Very-short-patch mismatch repair endonuclease (G-T specific) [uncultured Caballeronia sp.]